MEVQGLSKSFGPIIAVDELTFNVDRGEVLGILGPNGAGKTTAMRMITGYLQPTRGRAIVCGFDAASAPLEVAKRIGYLPEGAPLYGEMTPAGLFSFVADVRGIGGAEKRARIDEAVARLELREVYHQPIETLSKGFKRRVGLAQALLHDPEVLILDEPTDGLDPNQKHQVRRLLTQMGGDKAIIVSTHILEEVDAICTRAIIVARGRIVADDTPAGLAARSAFHNAVGVTVATSAAKKVEKLLAKVAGVAGVKKGDTVNGQARFLALSKGGADILAPVRGALDGAKIAVGEMYVERGRLDDVFRTLTAEG